MYKHAVIISSYNRPRMICEAIQSVVYQRASVQVLIADDDSDAETVEAIEKEIAGRPYCQLLRANRPREGEFKNVTRRATACINDALALVDAEFVHYLPDDDLFGSCRFWVFERFFRENPDVDVAYGRMFVVDENENHRRRDELYVGTPITDVVNWIDHGQFCHRASVLKSVPSWPATPHYAFDANFLLALVAAGYVFYPVDHVVNYKRVHGRNLMDEGDRNAVETARET